MTLYKDILARFPRGGISYVFAYGSGVKQQIGYADINQQKNNIIDLVFCVRDPLGWHAENISRHESHYSAMRHLGPKFIMKYQENFGAGVYFNTLVPLPDLGVQIKYGVISKEQMLQDLLEWRHLYMAGRLHKPVQDIVAPDDDEQMKQALATNLRNAFHIALIMLPEKFTSYQLFHAIANLSYKGDFRMIFGENKNKVANIVKAQENDFFELYKPAMKDLAQYVAVDFAAKEKGSENVVTQFEQDKSIKATEYHLRQAPAELRRRLIRNAVFKGSYIDIVEPLAALKNLHEIVAMSVNDIVWRSSITQTLKNIPSAGITKSLVYAGRKAMKTFAK
ncbi:phosphatidate cytidylyltransferase, mitochondrial-like [Musca vetustissima]|uniref:phosphatidate cytidylyltransferase, mitochondrial-like n=1 Tax=Musca vetustissima TaxID=27455 RepID=UPI002AB690CB|nr:phosphatidate cytidylyltransferase, mitochondrial-like [Musca vetustissima]